jgi:hypothetical protein
MTMSPEIRTFLAIVLGILMTSGLPAFVSWLKSCDWPTWKKSGLALLASLGVGLLTVAVHGDVDWQNITAATTAVFTASTLIYQTWFKDTDLNRRLEAKQVLP